MVNSKSVEWDMAIDYDLLPKQVFSAPDRNWKHKPTDEQIAGLDLCLTGANVSLRARAGSGKTFALTKAVSESRWRSKAMFAFANANAKDLRANNPDIAESIKTFHASMYQLSRQQLRGGWTQQSVDKIKYNKIARGVVARQFDKEKDEVKGLAYNLGQMAETCIINLVDVVDKGDLIAMLDIGRFTINAEIPLDLVVYSLNKILKRGRDLADSTTERSISFADMLTMPIRHNLRFPQYDLVIGDEMQDCNATQIEILRRIEAQQRIIAGDEKQAIYCQPAGTIITVDRDTVVPIEELTEGGKVMAYARRDAAFYKNKEVLRHGSRQYSGKMFTVTTSDKRTTECTENHRWIVRWLDRATDKNVVYLMRKGSRFRVGWCQLFSNNSTLHLGQRARIEQADEAWILSAHSTKQEASAAEKVVSTRFQLPLIQFKESNDGNASHLTQEVLDSIFKSISETVNLRENAIKCLTAHGRSIDWAFWSASQVSAKQGRTTLFDCRAVNLLDGLMKVPVYDGDAKHVNWQAIQVKSRLVTNVTVYSMDVDKYETYIANGIVTGNCFAGAYSDSLDRVEQGLEITLRTPLSYSFRCPKSVIRYAQEIVPDIKAMPDAPEGIRSECNSAEMMTILEAMPRGKTAMILCRLTAPLISRCLMLLKRGINANVRGQEIGAQLVHLVTTLEQKCAGNLPSLPIAMEMYLNEQSSAIRKTGFRSAARQIATLKDKLAAVGYFYELMNPPTFERLRMHIQQIISDDAVTSVELMTTHRVKGLEANIVFLDHPELMPFSFPGSNEQEEDQEDHLIYVARTRAMEAFYEVI